ncbi:unnamed protein product [Allacma fusca]|uniref:Uncharacterized protein n=1 Tax=Allacma fusca TaxID=39272 RepID=A0A8J2NSB1_9HEXA|nr:unnamed protein product [Allacma fusca]
MTAQQRRNLWGEEEKNLFLSSSFLIDQDDFYINLSTSVRHFARALGHMLIYCHWHSFAVLFDDSPSILSSQIIWEEELSQMKLGDPSFRDYSSPDSSSASNYTDYDYNEHPIGSGMNTMFENGDGDGLDDPILNPNFVTLRTKSSNAAFRALSELTKATQGVIVLLCSQRSLIQVFRAAQQLRMLNGDYVFILVGQYSQFEVIPDWIPSGVLALRSPRSAQIGKHTMKATGKLLASALISVKNKRISPEALQEPPRPTPARPYSSFAYPTNQDSGGGGQRGRQDVQKSFVERKNKVNSLNGPAQSIPPTSPQSFPPWKNPRRNFIQPPYPSGTIRTLNEDHIPHQQHLSGGVFSGLGSTSDFMTNGMKTLPTQGNANEQSSDHSLTVSDGPSEHSKLNSTSKPPAKVPPSLQSHRQGYNRSRKSLIRDLPSEDKSVQDDQLTSAQLRLAPLMKSTSRSYLDHHNNQKLMMTPPNEETSDDDGAIQDESSKSPPQMVFTSATVIRPSRNRQNSPSAENQRQPQGGGGSARSSSGSTKSILDLLDNPPNISCWKEPPPAARKIVSVAVTRLAHSRGKLFPLLSSTLSPLHVGLSQLYFTSRIAHIPHYPYVCGKEGVPHKPPMDLTYRYPFVYLLHSKRFLFGRVLHAFLTR